MVRFGTHDSGTGEPSLNWFSKLLIPFARTQDKCLEQQWIDGSRMFDLRVREHKGRLILAHGLWKSKTTLAEAVTLLSRMGKLDGEQPTYVTITYEGTMSDSAAADFAARISRMMRIYTGVRLLYIAIKLPEWQTVYAGKYSEYTTKGFKDLSTLPYMLLPIPRFWNLFTPHKGDEVSYTLVDFI